MPIPPRGGSSVVVPLRDAAVSVARRIPNWEGMIAEGPGGEGSCRDRGIAVIDHGAVQELAGQLGASAVARDQGGPGRQTAAGAGTSDHQPLRIDAELGRVGRGPHQPGIAVLDGAGIGEFRGQAIFDAHGHGVVLREQLLGEGHRQRHLTQRSDHLRGDHRQLLGDRVHRGLGLGVEGRTVRDAGHQGSSFLAAASESRSHQPGMLRNRRMRQVEGNRSAMRAPWGA